MKLRVGKVGEPGRVATVEAEFEAFPEPKVLTGKELAEVVTLHGSYQKSAHYIGASEAFVRQNCAR